MANPSPLVSVVIPTHDRPRFLGRAVASALRQTHPHLEVLVIDDGSAMPAVNALGPLRRDPRLHVLRHDLNRGGSAARNTGIEAARGDYIAFLDDDDWWKPTKIERQLAEIGTADAIICGFGLSAGDGREQPGSRRRHGTTDVTSARLRRGYVGWGTSTLMVLRDVMRQLMFDVSLPAGQDWDVLIRMAEQYRVVYFDEPLSVFEIGDHARITTRLVDLPIEHLEKRFRVLYKHHKFLGRFWFNYHMAGVLLYGVRRRADAVPRLQYAIRRCGPLPVFVGFVNRFYQRLAGY